MVIDSLLVSSSFRSYVTCTVGFKNVWGTDYLMKQKTSHTFLQIHATLVIIA